MEEGDDEGVSGSDCVDFAAAAAADDDDDDDDDDSRNSRACRIASLRWR